MRAKHVATALVVIAAGVSATAALRRFAGRRRVVMIRPAAPVAVPQPQARPSVDQDAVVLRFTPRAGAAPAPAQPTAPVRCGDTGGRTKAGAPCGARATSGGRCHHHKLAG